MRKTSRHVAQAGIRRPAARHIAARFALRRGRHPERVERAAAQEEAEAYRLAREHGKRTAREDEFRLRGILARERRAVRAREALDGLPVLAHDLRRHRAKPAIGIDEEMPAVEDERLGE